MPFPPLPTVSSSTSALSLKERGQATFVSALPLKRNGHQPVNNACAVPARVAVGRVLSGSIGKSAGEIRVANE